MSGTEPAGRPGQTKFVILPVWVMALGQRPAMTYAALASFAREGETYVGLPTVAERLGVTINTVRSGVRELEDAGAVVIEPRYRDDGSRTTNEYRLLIDPPLQDIGGAPHQPVGGAPPQTVGGVVTRRKDELEETPNGVSLADDQPARPEVTELCNLLATQVFEQTGARPTVSKAWERDMRLTLDRPRAPGAEPWTALQVEYVIRWLGGVGERPQFWAMNVRCPGKLRSKMQRLVDEIKAERRGPSTASRVDRIRNIDPATIPTGNPFEAALANARRQVTS